jgi:hypothetical protein
VGRGGCCATAVITITISQHSPIAGSFITVLNSIFIACPCLNDLSICGGQRGQWSLTKEAAEMRRLFKLRLIITRPRSVTTDHLRTAKREQHAPARVLPLAMPAQDDD